MTTTTMPPDSDLPWFRIELQKRIGNPLGDIGVLPDASHKSSGGYHCGSFDLKNIGRGIPPASGKTTDYSARSNGDPAYYKFEIAHGSNMASAMDVPGPWFNGGQAAWIRWNNYIVADLRADPSRIPGLRAINFTPDGSVKRRYDSNNPDQGIISSTDTVLWHTHLEWWRDSVMRRMAGFLRLLALAEDAIANRPARPIGAPTNIVEAMMYAGTFFSCNGVTNGPKFFGIPGVLCSWVQTAEETSLNSLEDGQWIDQIAPAHSDAAAPGVSRKLINIVGDVPPGFEDRAAFKPSDTVAIVTGVLQGLADDPQVDVSQATVDTIATAVRAKFAADPLK
jgi:hypothetical protein